MRAGWKTIAAVAAAAVALAGCGGGKSDRPGEPSVYERIDAMAACGELQHEFEIAMANVDRYPAGDERREIPLSYANAVVERQKEVYC